MKALVIASMLAAAAISNGPVAAQAAAPAPADTVALPAAALGLETVRLWQGRAPEASSDSAAETPTLTLFRPQFNTENGTAVIVAPGGGYMALSMILEGRQVADWFTSRGITAFLLQYRVGPKAHLPIPLLDGARAVRYVRANAARFKINPNRIGMIGFSAGGHLTAMTAGKVDAGIATSSDPIERVSSRPDFAILGYPWLEGTAIEPTGKSEYCRFQGTACDSKRYIQYRPINDVTENFPPTFIYHTTTDSIVHANGVVSFYQALVAKKVPVEMHVFANGPHGTGLGGADPALTRWPELLEEWLRGQGLLKKAQ
ncbi:MAG TPA: alpha/beta hydrolase [Sphingobium sp.]